MELLQLMFFILAVVAVCVSAQRNDTEGVEEYIRHIAKNEIQELAYGQDFEYYIKDKLTTVVQENGKCIMKNGKMSRYDLENHHCFNCSDEKAMNNVLLVALCEDPLTIDIILIGLKKSESENRDLLARTDELKRNQDIMIAFFAVAGFILIVVGVNLFLLRKYRFNKTMQSTDDVENSNQAVGQQEEGEDKESEKGDPSDTAFLLHTTEESSEGMAPLDIQISVM